jgi:UrcA family protein
MSSIKTFAALIASAAIALPAITAPAFAGDRVTFEFNSNELNSASGVNNLYEKINDRAESLCDELRIAPKLRHEICVADLVGDFVGNIDDAQLNTVHAAATSSDQYANR